MPQLTPPGAHRFDRFLLAVFAVFALPLLALAQTSGTITGRVLNTGTGEYIRNADVKVGGTNLGATSEDGGYYYIYNVPAGTHTVTITYPGADPVSADVNVTAGATATHDFEIALSREHRAGEDVVKLEKFVVETEREGQSKMIAEQKQAINMKQVVSTDNFGDMSEQNVGEFLKYLPGITIDYVETDTRSASMMGLDPKYGYVTLDGNPQASGDSGSFGGNTRQFEFESISMNNIESVEVNKTLTPDMWADAPAGTVNLRTRSAIDTKRPKFGFRAGFITNALESGSPWKRTPRHDDGLHAKTRPRLDFDYSSGPILGGKVGITLNGSFTNIYKLQYRESLGFDYNPPASLGVPAVVNSINFKDGPKISEKSAGGIKIDYEPYRGLRMTVAGSYSYFSDFFANRNLNFVTTTANLAPGSSLTKVIANNSNNTNTRIDQSGESTGKQKDNTNLSYFINWRHGPWVVDLSTLYSRARQTRGALFYGTIGNTPVRLSRIGFTAERTDVKSPAWNIIQTSGGNWYDWNNWGVYDAQDVNANREIGQTEQYTGKIDISRVMSWDIPTTYKFGAAEQVMAKHRWNAQQFYGRYVGPTGNALTSRMPLSKATFNIDKGWGGGIGPLPVVDKEAMYVLLRDHPEYYTQSTANIVSQINAIAGSFQSNQEDVRAGYIMQTSKVGRWQLMAGVRFENTRTTSRVPDEVPIPMNPYATKGTKVVNGVTVTTYAATTSLDYANYRWSRGDITTWGGYSDWMPSAAAKFQINKDMDLKLGYNKAIKRPDLDKSAGPWKITTDDNTGDITVTIPNPDVKPERSDTLSAMFEYYLKNAGVASVHVYQVRIKNAIDDSPDGVSADEVGLGGIPEFAGYLFKTYFNLNERRTVRGIELSYRQSLLMFQNPWIRGTTVWASYAQRAATPRPRNGTRYFPRNASGGVTWRYGKVQLSVNGTWTDETYVSDTQASGGPSSTAASNPVPTLGNTTPFAPEYYKPRTILFVDARYKLNNNLSLFLSGDRAYDSGKIWYYKYDGRFRQVEKYGSQWSFGIRGDF
jgi:iron complex outermembrane recepter protein